MNYYLTIWWVVVGSFMIYMNDFNFNTFGWLFLIGSPVWLYRKGV